MWFCFSRNSETACSYGFKSCCFFQGNDDIYICGKDSTGNLQVQHAISTGKSAPTILSLVYSPITPPFLLCDNISLLTHIIHFYRGMWLISRQHWMEILSIVLLHPVMWLAREVEQRRLASTTSWLLPDPPTQVCASVL